jgi:type IV conjugative transfer system protein TraE
MLFKNFKQNWVAVVKENILYLTVIGALTLAVLVLSFSLVSAASNQRVIVVPAFIDKKFSFEGNKPSRTYLEMMGNAVVSFLLNYNPKTVDYKFSVFLSMVPPEYHGSLESKLKKIAKEVKKYGVSQAFAPTGRLEVYRDKIIIRGILYRYSMGKLINSVKVAYVLRYRINPYGKFEVLSYEIQKDKKPGVN